MELYVGINRVTMDIILISDRKERIEEKIKKTSAKDNCDSIQICSTGNVSFSSGFTADVSYAYELQCLEESILTRLSELEIDTDSAQTKPLLDRLVMDAYYDIMHYNASEDYAISEAFRMHKDELETLTQLAEKDNSVGEGQ